ncbi:MAG: hypothetical protein N2971_00590 [Chlorobi bacterium]|nr:hypothetical protein [Chlorobiota bacterium]
MYWLRYTRWHESATTAEQEIERLFRLFRLVLLKVDMDVNEALRLMELLDERYGVLGQMTMDEFIELLRAHGLIEEHKGQLRPTAKTERLVRTDALQEIFRTLKSGQLGNHEIPHAGQGTELLPELRPYLFGDSPSLINLTATFQNVLLRDSTLEAFPLQEEDIAVHETEHMTSCATVLAIDISHSMVLYGEDRITPAKQVALALVELISTKYPKDLLEVVVFGDEARRIERQLIPYITVGPFHTNTRDALRLSRQILRRSRAANKQVFMITDGKPSAIFEDNGRLYKNPFGLDPRIVNKTLDEAVACRREGITISTFMIAQDAYLRSFVEELTRANRGRAMYCDLDQLGKVLVVDYIRNRRSYR